jgi:2-(1,2-epoxy-1,2-dihydrophenyl)acetyl-CoA isomerase
MDLAGPMSDANVKVEMRSGVACITLNRPNNGNTLCLGLVKELLAAAIDCGSDPAVKAVVLSGAGRHFCFGGDLREILENEARVAPYLAELTTYLHAAISQFVRMPVPVIAAVNGTAAGAGVGLVAMADLAICGQSTTFNLAYTGVGLTPDGGTSFLLPRAIGQKRAMELLLSNRSLRAPEALDWGFVNRVVEDTEVMTQALSLAERLCTGATHALGKAKRLVVESLASFESHLKLESETIAAQALTAEAREGIAAFLQKRTPKFS